MCCLPECSTSQAGIRRGPFAFSPQCGCAAKELAEVQVREVISRRKQRDELPLSPAISFYIPLSPRSTCQAQPGELCSLVRSCTGLVLRSSQAGIEEGWSCHPRIISTALALSGPGAIQRPAESTALASSWQRSDPSLVLAQLQACSFPVSRCTAGKQELVPLCSWQGLHQEPALLSLGRVPGACSPTSCSLGASFSCPWPRAQQVWAGSGRGCWDSLRLLQPTRKDRPAGPFL